MKPQRVHSFRLLVAFTAIATVQITSGADEARTKCLPPSPQPAVDRIAEYGGTVVGYTDRDTGEEICNGLVRFANTSLTDADILRLQDAIAELQPAALDLSFTLVTGRFISQLSRPLESLQDLDLSSDPVDSASLETLSGNEHLKYLRLNCDRLVVENIVAMLNRSASVPFRTGIHLYLSRAIMSAQSATTPGATQELSVDEWLPRLIPPTACGHQQILLGLDVSHTGLTNVGLKPHHVVQCFANLHQIILAGNKGVDDSGLAFLSDNKELLYLDLSGTGLKKNATLEDFHGEKLLTLVLSNTLITDVGLRAVLTMAPHLKSIDISNTPTLATPKLRDAIGRLKHLLRLKIAGTGITDGGLEQIWLAGFNSEHTYEGRLTELDISNTLVTNRGLVCGKRAVIPTLHNLKTDDSKITTAGRKYRSAVMFNNPEANLTKTPTGLTAPPGQEQIDIQNRSIVEPK